MHFANLSHRTFLSLGQELPVNNVVQNTLIYSCNVGYAEKYLQGWYYSCFRQ